MGVFLLDIKKGIKKPLENPFSRTISFLAVLRTQAGLVRIAKIMHVIVSKKGLNMKFSDFGFRFKDRNVVEFLNILGKLYHACMADFNLPHKADELCLKHYFGVIFAAMIFWRKLSTLINRSAVTAHDIKLSIILGCQIIAWFRLAKRVVTTNTFVLCKGITGDMVRNMKYAFNAGFEQLLGEGEIDERPSMYVGPGALGSLQHHEQFQKMLGSEQYLVDLTHV